MRHQTGIVGASGSMVIGWMALFCNAYLPHNVAIVTPVDLHHHMPSHGMEGLLDSISDDVKLEKRQRSAVVRESE